MKNLHLSFPTPEENLACDEALLDLCEEDGAEEILRFWESKNFFVVLGYSNKVQTEVHAAACEKDRVPVLRRPSGGGTVLQGPGCLNFSLVLKIPEKKGPLSNIVTTNRAILNRHREALAPHLGKDVRVQGTSDLTLGPLKFSGNAQRRRRRHLLFHGTFLYGFDLEKIGKYLNTPSRQPEYRCKRPHHEFVTNIPLPEKEIRNALQKKWGAEEPLLQIPTEKIQRLVKEKYSKRDWNYKF